MLLSFAYLAFTALVRLLAAGGRDPFAREVELLALRSSRACCIAGLRPGRPPQAGEAK
jgi:hypothetical protein